MLAILIILTLLIFFLTGIPVAFALGIVSTIYIFITKEVSMISIAQRMINSLDSFPLMAIPFFVLAGRLMNSSGATNKIFEFANNLVGHLKGGLGYVNVLASMLFAGMSGSAVADASGLGAVEMEAMINNGYDKNFSAAITGASAIIGPIIPPSIPMVIYGSVVSVSVGRLFLGGIIPGVLLGLAFMIRIFLISKKRNFPCGEKQKLKKILKSFISSAPALFLPIIILGGIVSGIFTPTEAAAIAVIYSIFLAIFVYKCFDFKQFQLDLIESAKTVVILLLIISCAAVFGLVLTRLQIPQKITSSLLSISENPLITILLIDALLLFVGTIIEGTAALIILGPMLSVITQELGLDPVFVGIIVVLNLMIGLVTPPVGMVIFVLSRISGISVNDFMKEEWGFLLMMIIVVLIISFFPGIVTFIPNFLMGPIS